MLLPALLYIFGIAHELPNPDPKGQLISKYLFGVFNFLKKTERKQVELRFHNSKVELEKVLA